MLIYLTRWCLFLYLLVFWFWFKKKYFQLSIKTHSINAFSEFGKSIGNVMITKHFRLSYNFQYLTFNLNKPLMWFNLMSSLKKLISSPCSSNWYSVSLCVREKRGLIKATFITKDALSYPSDLQKRWLPLYQTLMEKESFM